MSNFFKRKNSWDVKRLMKHFVLREAAELLWEIAQRHYYKQHLYYKAPCIFHGVKRLTFTIFKSFLSLLFDNCTTSIKGVNIFFTFMIMFRYLLDKVTWCNDSEFFVFVRVIFSFRFWFLQLFIQNIEHCTILSCD